MAWYFLTIDGPKYPKANEIYFIREREGTYVNPMEWGGAQCANYSSFSCFFSFVLPAERCSPSGVATAVVVLAAAMVVLLGEVIPFPAERAAIWVGLGGTRAVHRAFHPAVPIPEGPGTQVPAPTMAAEAFRAVTVTGAAGTTGPSPGYGARGGYYYGGRPYYGRGGYGYGGGLYLGYYGYPGYYSGYYSPYYCDPYVNPYGCPAYDPYSYGVSPY